MSEICLQQSQLLRLLRHSCFLVVARGFSLGKNLVEDVVVSEGRTDTVSILWKTSQQPQVPREQEEQQQQQQQQQQQETTMADEARSILDSLMGGDRNAPLPRGTAVPKRKRKSSNSHSSSSSSSSAMKSSGPLLLPTKRSRSCYDQDIDPLYCAWGIDVYELFVNTKSDLGPNPKTPDDGARQEYQSLPPHEQERLGFEAMLFSKLTDLVRSCDRTVSRNKDKLAQELQRNLQSRQGKDYYVQDIDEAAVEQLARTTLQMQDIQEEIHQIIAAMETSIQQEQEALQQNKEKQQKEKEEEEKKEEEKKEPEEKDKVTEGKQDMEEEQDEKKIKEEEEEEKKVKEEEPAKDEKVKKEEDKDNDAANGDDDAKSKQDEGVKAEPPVEEEQKEQGKEEKEKDDTDSRKKQEEEQEEQNRLSLREATVKKQRCMFDLARRMQTYAPLVDSVEQQRKQLYFVKSDITSDKTVCEVSGNFMSARDADERIAAHYAGKQYVGWKLVRDKLQEMQTKHGRYGPPRGHHHSGGGGGGRRHSSYSDDRRRSSSSSTHDDRYRERRGSDRGPRNSYSGGGYDRGGGGGGGGGYSRNYGSDRRGGGGYDRGGGGGYGGRDSRRWR